MNKMTNAITRVEIKDFLVFKGEFTADFCPGINVFIGENGTGKTTLMYAAAMWSPIGHPYGPSEQYQAHLNKLRHCVKVSRSQSTGEAKIEEIIEEIFIPANEMLSHPDILPFAQKYNSTFNAAELKTLANAMLPVTNEITPNAAKVLDKIKAVIRGEVVYENDTFFVIKEDNGKVPFSLEASGFRKLGLLWKLLRNGLLEFGTILFWDEPENSLNPELVPVLVDILFELQRGGVQVFVATHSKMLANEFSISCESGDEVKFFSLYKADNGTIKVDTDERFDLLQPNKLTEASVAQYEREIERGLCGHG
jgi:AAA15 family ATPase/GTPase